VEYRGGRVAQAVESVRVELDIDQQGLCVVGFVRGQVRGDGHPDIAQYDSSAGGRHEDVLQMLELGYTPPYRLGGVGIVKNRIAVCAPDEPPPADVGDSRVTDREGWAARYTGDKIAVRARRVAIALR
jgi:hypothetical protein